MPSRYSSSQAAGHGSAILRHTDVCDRETGSAARKSIQGAASTQAFKAP